MDNSNSILFLSSTISVLLSEMERYLALHERVKSELDHILDALDNLSNNLLSHSVVRPSVLKRLIEHVKQQLAEKYTNYQWSLTREGRFPSELRIKWPFKAYFEDKSCQMVQGNKCKRDVSRSTVKLDITVMSSL